MTSLRHHALPEGAPRLPVRVGGAIAALFVSVFLSSLSRDERRRQAAAGDAPVFNAPTGDAEPWPAYLFDQYWPR